MKVIVCVDDRGGMMFNKRRLSRDKEVLKDILSDLGGAKLCMNKYSSSLFVDKEELILVEEDFLKSSENNEVCFVEDELLMPYIDKIDTLTVYKWNRCYPADFYLDLELDKWNKTDVNEFGGNSHEKITKEIYTKGEV